MSYKALLKVLMQQNRKEVPNTAGIKTWPNPPSPDAHHHRRISQKGKTSSGHSSLTANAVNEWRSGSGIKNNNNWTGVTERSDLYIYYWEVAVYNFYILWRRAEYYLFIFGGSYMWYCMVMKVLEWNRFPRHLYTVELCLVVTIPIVIIILIINMMERVFYVKDE